MGSKFYHFDKSGKGEHLSKVDVEPFRVMRRARMIFRYLFYDGQGFMVRKDWA